MKIKGIYLQSYSYLSSLLSLSSKHGEKLIVLTQPIISTVICSSCLINLNMKIYINIRTKRKNAAKIKGYTYKITNIAAANCPRVANIMPNSSLCITILPSGIYKNYLICIRSILIKTLKIQEKIYTN